MCKWASHCPTTWESIDSAPCKIIHNFSIWDDCGRIKEETQTRVPSILLATGWDWEVARNFFSTWWTGEKRKTA